MSPVVEHSHRNKTRMIWAATAVASVLVTAIAIHIAIYRQNLSDQAALQSQMTDTLSTNYTGEASAATQLINGKLSGKFNFSDKLLAQYYLDGAVAYSNLKQYSKAVAYYQAAPKYDSTVQIAALEGQAYSGYAAGERSQLIPTLTKLETLSANVHNPMAPTAAQYQSDIQAIQHNQPAENL